MNRPTCRLSMRPMPRWHTNDAIGKRDTKGVRMQFTTGEMQLPRQWSGSRRGPGWATALAFSTVAILSAPVLAQSGSPQSASGTGGREVVLITGSTDGLGRELAYRIAATGAHVIVHGRNRERGAEVVARIEEEGKGSARFYPADFAVLDDVRQFGQAILRDYDRLDLLVNNAGIARIGQNDRLLSSDGQELHFAVNYLAGYLLTRMLLPRLRSSRPARIINVSSRGQSPIAFDDITLEHGYTFQRAYGQSKLAQIMFAIDLANELEGSGVSAYSLHPASAMNTNMILEAGVRPQSTVEEGADAVMYLVTTDGLQSGQFFFQLTPARANEQAYDQGARARLKTLSDRLVGISDDHGRP
jgi:NAD(P)-dependent dehydrogenase (short-subunit alcohol dehydrogenase family)